MDSTQETWQAEPPQNVGVTIDRAFDVAMNDDPQVYAGANDLCGLRNAKIEKQPEIDDSSLTFCASHLDELSNELGHPSQNGHSVPSQNGHSHRIKCITERTIVPNTTYGTGPRIDSVENPRYISTKNVSNDDDDDDNNMDTISDQSESKSSSSSNSGSKGTSTSDESIGNNSPIDHDDDDDDNDNNDDDDDDEHTSHISSRKRSSECDISGNNKKIKRRYNRSEKTDVSYARKFCHDKLNQITSRANMENARKNLIELTEHLKCGKEFNIKKCIRGIDSKDDQNGRASDQSMLLRVMKCSGPLKEYLEKYGMELVDAFCIYIIAKFEVDKKASKMVRCKKLAQATHISFHQIENIDSDDSRHFKLIASVWNEYSSKINTECYSRNSKVKSLHRHNKIVLLTILFFALRLKDKTHNTQNLYKLLKGKEAGAFNYSFSFIQKYSRPSSEMLNFLNEVEFPRKSKKAKNKK